MLKPDEKVACVQEVCFCTIYLAIAVDNQGQFLYDVLKNKYGNENAYIANSFT